MFLVALGYLLLRTDVNQSREVEHGSGIYVAMTGARNQERRLDTYPMPPTSNAWIQSPRGIYRQVHNDVTAMGNPNQAMGMNHPVRFLLKIDCRLYWMSAIRSLVKVH